MPAYGSYLLYALALTVAFPNLAAAGLRHVAPRQDSDDVAPSTIPAEPTTTPDPTATDVPQGDVESATDASAPPDATTESSPPPEETEVASETEAPTESSTTPSVTETPSDAASATPTATSAPEEVNPLPVQPIITPAIGLAGVILLVSGAVYTVIGIKNRWLYISLSTAYLTSLAVTVLIVYVMKPPVSDAVQGAFFVAAFFTGVAFGALSLIFQEVAEGFGCLLGGFCLSMWFLSLKEGGLLTTTTGKAVFVAVMSCTAFALSFSHYTRMYGLIVCISFAGATVTILGIDCFSRAGLKEFWLYIWGLNADIFPLETNTYPVTRGIRVEIAGTVLIFLLGIISQLKLWKLIKQRRERKDADRLAEGQRQERIEEEVGRRVQHDVGKERAQWEAHFGNKADSGLGSSRENVNKTSVSVRETRRSSSESIEMADMRRSHATTERPRTRAPDAQTSRDSTLQVDDASHSLQPSRRTSRNSATLQANSEESVRASLEIEPLTPVYDPNRSSVPPPPEVVPLPIPLPVPSSARLSQAESLQVVPEKSALRRSLSKRLSDGSAAFRLSASRNPNVTSVSQEALVSPFVEEDRESSIAATIDGLDEEDLSLPAWSRPASAVMWDQKQYESVEDTASSGGQEGAQAIGNSNEEESAGAAAEKGKIGAEERRYSATSQKSSTSRASDAGNKAGKGDAEQDGHESKTSRSRPRSLKSRPTSVDGNLAEQLPERLSKVALVYRTNEWAKYLADAERPDVEELPEPESPGVRVELGFQESAAATKEPIKEPTKGKERRASQLAQEETLAAVAEESAAAPALVSSTSVRSRPPSVARSTTGDTLGPTLSRNPSATTLTVVRPGSAQSHTPVQAGSFQGARSASLARAEARGLRSSSTPILAQPLVESPIEDDRQPTFTPPVRATPSPIPGSTLMGKRESMVRNKPAGGFSFHPSTSTPHLSPAPLSDLPPVPGPAASASASAYGSRADDVPLSERKQQLLMTQRQMAISPAPGAPASGRASALSNFDSHQPKRTSGIDHEEQASRYAKWRASTAEMMQNPAGGAGGAGTGPTAAAVADEGRRAAMLAERRQAEARRQQSEQYAAYRDSAFDSMMRSGDMHGLHREVMRKMQASANKNA